MAGCTASCEVCIQFPGVLGLLVNRWCSCLHMSIIWPAIVRMSTFHSSNSSGFFRISVTLMRSMIESIQGKVTGGTSACLQHVCHMTVDLKSCSAAAQTVDRECNLQIPCSVLWYEAPQRVLHTTQHFWQSSAINQVQPLLNLNGKAHQHYAPNRQAWVCCTKQSALLPQHLDPGHCLQSLDAPSQKSIVLFCKEHNRVGRPLLFHGVDTCRVVCAHMQQEHWALWSTLQHHDEPIKVERDHFGVVIRLLEWCAFDHIMTSATPCFLPPCLLSSHPACCQHHVLPTLAGWCHMCMPLWQPSFQCHAQHVRQLGIGKGKPGVTQGWPRPPPRKNPTPAQGWGFSGLGVRVHQVSRVRKPHWVETRGSTYFVIIKWAKSWWLTKRVWSYALERREAAILK